MKKQFFTLVMMLAIVVLAGTSAMAQGTGTKADPITHISGSTHTFSVTTDGGTHTFDWSLHLVSDNSDPSTAYTATATAGSYEVYWTDQAAGQYYIQVIDHNDAGCTTTRRFYVNVLSFDVRVAAVNSSGTELANNAEVCGDNNANAGYIFDNVQAGASLVTVNPDNNGSLTNSRGTIYTTQWFKLTLAFEAGLTAPTYDNITFDYTITATNAGGTSVTTDVYQFNSETPDGNAAINSGTGDWTVPIQFYDRWNAANDITYSVRVTNFTIRNSTTIVGVEKADNEATYPSNSPNQNTSGNVILNAAPGTSVITVAP